MSSVTVKPTEEQAWHNAYLFHIGEITFDNMEEDKPYFFPENFEDRDMVIKHFQDLEEYEKCQDIIDAQLVDNG